MRLVGAVLLIIGVVVLLYGGVSYTKSRHSTNIGPVQVSTVKKGFITPAAGAVIAVVGLVVMAAARRNTM
jgi:TRAP-type C4-dicarboxylate transport system permease small subunit